MPQVVPPSTNPDAAAQNQQPVVVPEPPKPEVLVSAVAQCKETDSVEQCPLNDPKIRAEVEKCRAGGGAELCETKEYIEKIRGYIASKKDEVVTATPVDAACNPRYITADDVNFRTVKPPSEEAAKTMPAAGTFIFRDEVTVGEVDSFWATIKYKGQDGFVALKFLSCTKPEPKPEPKTEAQAGESKTGTTTTTTKPAESYGPPIPNYGTCTYYQVDQSATWVKLAEYFVTKGFDIRNCSNLTNNVAPGYFGPNRWYRDCKRVLLSCQCTIEVKKERPNTPEQQCKSWRGSWVKNQ
jgi:hypothetical protein